MKKHNVPNKSNIVDKIEWQNILPNCHIFNNEKDYHNYLIDNPITNNLRFILLLFNKPDDFIQSGVYEINYSNKYINNLHNSNFENIVESNDVLKSDNDM